MMATSVRREPCHKTEKCEAYVSRRGGNNDQRFRNLTFRRSSDNSSPISNSRNSTPSSLSFSISEMFLNSLYPGDGTQSELAFSSKCRCGILMQS